MRKWRKRETWFAHKDVSKGDRSIPVTIEERPDAGKYGRWRVMQNGKPLAATLTLDGALAWIHNHDYKLLTLEDFDEPPAETPAHQLPVDRYWRCDCGTPVSCRYNKCHRCGNTLF